MTTRTSLASQASPAFAACLRDSTRGVHTRAEKTTFIRGFLRGTASPSSYVRLLAALHPVYRAMEEELERLAPTHSVLARFHFPALYRAAAIERDLLFLAGPNWSAQVPIMHASEAYTKRIRLIAVAEPTRLVGHLYTRYLGDLSGGQILARIAERSLGLTHGAGLDFYEFADLPDIPAMKTQFRARLDELDALTDAQRSAIIDEAIAAFRHNIAIFELLKGNALTSFFRNLPLPWVRAPRFAGPTSVMSTAVGAP